MTEKLSSLEPTGRAIQDNLERIREKIANAAARAGRAESEVTLLAVTKTVEAARINEAISLGITQIGENRVQEFLGKREALLPVQAHLIGHLQTNKVNQIVGKVQMIQSVDSLRLATVLNNAAQKQGITLDILAEVNIGGEEAKSGVSPETAVEFCEQLQQLSALRLCGLMTVPPISETEAQKRKYFSEMCRLFIDIRDKNRDNRHICILSMGMSDDFEEAILEGSTMVRIGSAIFGKRQYTI